MCGRQIVPLKSFNLLLLGEIQTIRRSCLSLVFEKKKHSFVCKQQPPTIPMNTITIHSKEQLQMVFLTSTLSIAPITAPTSTRIALTRTQTPIADPVTGPTPSQTNPMTSIDVDLTKSNYLLYIIINRNTRVASSAVLPIGIVYVPLIIIIITKCNTNPTANILYGNQTNKWKINKQQL